MAAPVTHAVLTEKVSPLYFSRRNKKRFFVGTLFPDIRYLANVGRGETHLREVSFSQVLKTSDDFEAGLQFHALIDQIWHQLFGSGDFNSKQGIKLTADELLYDKTENWQEIRSFFNEILPQELEYGIERRLVERWHRMLQQYFVDKPNRLMREGLWQGTETTPAMIESFEQAAHQLIADPKIKAEIFNLCGNIGGMLEAYDLSG